MAPRPKTQPDEDVLEAALAIMYEYGPDALTFASLSARCGLSGATLVQRFGTKTALKQRALLYDWNRLDRETARQAHAVAKTPEGAIEFLVGLSARFYRTDSYSDMLRLLREDLRDPALRDRAAQWRRTVSRFLDECFDAVPGLPGDVGSLMASQWQGAHLLWNFDPQGKVEDFVEQSLTRFVGFVLGATPNGHHQGSSPE